MKLTDHTKKLEEIAKETGYKYQEIEIKYCKIWDHLYEKDPTQRIEYYQNETLRRTKVFYQAQLRMRQNYFDRMNGWLKE